MLVVATLEAFKGVCDFLDESLKGREEGGLSLKKSCQGGNIFFVFNGGFPPPFLGLSTCLNDYRFVRL